ncbi:hypothetical protein [Streptomyces sp. NBC_01477]|uniref:hypothetical protein n=1 Tax=Streptomyces sp. NBC_01477 TaxID=2976015 RepID=UPI002E34ED9A|nr:hypothetical protein [Streptomyces sp. NBC_01477]
MEETQIAAVHAEMYEAFDASHCWADSSVLDALLIGARAVGVLTDVDVFQLLDEDDRDLLLVSVELRPGVLAHAAPMRWRELRPAPGVLGVRAVRDVLMRLAGIADQVRVAHGMPR